MSAIVEITGGPADRDLLAEFYDSIYATSFTDPNERESLTRIRRFLRLKARGWYGRNTYHVFVLHEGGRPRAGLVCDYLHAARMGVIEFLAVDDRVRNRGYGRRLLDYAEAALRADAARAGAVCRGIAAEVEDPARLVRSSADMDPVQRLRVWNRWGYRIIDFPYVQPRLSPGREPVSHLFLTLKTLPKPRRYEAAQSVTMLLCAYMKWAMDIRCPWRHPDFRSMQRFLARRRVIRLRRSVDSRRRA